MQPGPDAASDVRPPRPDARADSAADAGPPQPCSVDGYLLDDAYDPACGFCYAQSKDKLPPPIAWATCDPTATPQGMVCRQMVEDWVPGQFGSEYISAQVPAWAQPNGTVTFMLGRLEWPNIYRIVADADGPVHQAILETKTDTCTLGLDDVRDGRVAYRVFDSESSPLSSFGGGAYVAQIDDLRPRVLAHYHNEKSNDRAYYVSSLGVFELGTAGFQLAQFDWTTGAPIRVITSAADDNGFGIAHVWPRGNAVFWDAYSGLAINKLRVWTADAGAKDFISYGADSSQGASNLGTDGTDLVWQYSSGRTDGGSVPFPKSDVMAAPFTADPTQLNARRLRSDGPQFGTNPFTVGCGYAAHFSTAIPNEVGVLVVRLSDGRSWPLTSPSTALWLWTSPIAITCTEIFALVRTKTSPSTGRFTVVRVRLDSLGPGLPPD